MSQVLEYVLVFAVSAVVGVAAIAPLGAFLGEMRGLAAPAAFSEILSAARRTVQSGVTTTVSENLRNGTLSCGDAILTLSQGGKYYSSSVGLPCAFSVLGPDRPILLSFTRDMGTLRLRVDR
jgi:hypothetical protein